MYTRSDNTTAGNEGILCMQYHTTQVRMDRYRRMAKYITPKLKSRTTSPVTQIGNPSLTPALQARSNTEEKFKWNGRLASKYAITEDELEALQKEEDYVVRKLNGRTATMDSLAAEGYVIERVLYEGATNFLADMTILEERMNGHYVVDVDKLNAEWQRAFPKVNKDGLCLIISEDNTTGASRVINYKAKALIRNYVLKTMTEQNYKAAQACTRKVNLINPEWIERQIDNPSKWNRGFSGLDQTDHSSVQNEISMLVERTLIVKKMTEQKIICALPLNGSDLVVKDEQGANKRVPEFVQKRLEDEIDQRATELESEGKFGGRIKDIYQRYKAGGMAEVQWNKVAPPKQGGKKILPEKCYTDSLLWWVAGDSPSAQEMKFLIQELNMTGVGHAP